MYFKLYTIFYASTSRLELIYDSDMVVTNSLQNIMLYPQIDVTGDYGGGKTRTTILFPLDYATGT